MIWATMVLGILFLLGYNVGKAMAICAIIVGVLTAIQHICKIIIEEKY